VGRENPHSSVRLRGRKHCTSLHPDASTIQALQGCPKGRPTYEERRPATQRVGYQVPQTKDQKWFPAVAEMTASVCNSAVPIV